MCECVGAGMRLSGFRFGYDWSFATGKRPRSGGGGVQEQEQEV